MNNLTDGVFFFDSGVGGLSVLSACRERLKGVTFYYYGDNQNAPYGNLPPERIFQRVQEIFVSCARLPIRAAVLACNTVTAVCVETLRKSLPFPIIGAEPAILLGARQGKRVLVLATKATCESLRFTLLLARAKELYPQAHVEAAACEQLAGVIERGLGRGEIDISPYLPKAQPDVVVLGCTHYVFVKEQIADFYNCAVVDGNQGIAARLQSVLDGLPSMPTNTPPLTPPPNISLQNTYQQNLISSLPVFVDYTLLKGKKSEGDILFLGEAKNSNLVIYEQMFAK